ncbi:MULTISPECIES: BREX system ATP-binding domain-containing protein [unclassified Micromonospora]|uniref:BREX system ATP-binding domain-containing protein n=1 Tax=unclassified Micromonospora TaxID=2617518 RepID=UPI0036455B5B
MSAAGIGVDDYLQFVEREYLTGYIAGGGASVKLLCPADDTVRDRLAAALAEIGQGFAYAEVDAATTRVHLIDQVFTTVARQLDWVGLAASVVRAALDHAGFPAPAETDGIDLGVIARHHDVDAAELYRSARRAVEQLVLRDTEMSHEFRVAMFRLCQERLGRGDVTADERQTVIGWLHGERLPAADLRRVGLNTKVNRYNARPLLVSLTRWLRIAGRPGLVLRLDLDRLAVSRRPPAGLRDGFYYAKAATLDAYELVRQLIDAVDEIEGLFVAVQVPPVLVHDEARGLPAYTALQLRVADEVRDRRRSNPYATLVRIGSDSAEVS